MSALCGDWVNTWEVPTVDRITIRPLDGELEVEIEGRRAIAAVSEAGGRPGAFSCVVSGRTLVANVGHGLLSVVFFSEDGIWSREFFVRETP